MSCSINIQHADLWNMPMAEQPSFGLLLGNHHLVCSWATIAKLSDLTETLHAGLISAARAAFQSLCSYGVPLLAVALTAWTAVRF